MPGLEEKGRGAPKGKGARIINASGPCRGQWEGDGRGGDKGVEGDWREGEQSCSMGQILCGFIRSSVNRWVFARTGTQGSVEESEREEREIKRTGITSCPGLHFAVIICTNSS